MSVNFIPTAAHSQGRFLYQLVFTSVASYNARKDFKVWTDHVNITDLDFKGKRVLDVATDEGWWAFWSEMQGAEYVEASDVERGEDYDWGLEKDWDWIIEFLNISTVMK